MHAIRTRYKGTMLRSRLEAKWACFFDQLKWKWEYEPFDLKGWIPDFIIFGKKQTLLVEIKPYSDEKQWDKVKLEIDSALRGEEYKNQEVLLIGIAPFYPNNGDEIFPNSDPYIGFISDNGCSEHNSYSERVYSEAPLIYRAGGIGVLSREYSFHDRISGIYEGGHWDPMTKTDAQNKWASAHNRTQWKRKV